MGETQEATKMDEQLYTDVRNEVLEDYKLAVISRECSLLGRREVLTGKAKFGIFGDGKELAQIAMSKQFQDGDWRSGYYRDQTFMMAIGELNVQQYFAALYAHTDIDHEPASGGRQMGGHYATRNLNEDGSWKNLMEQKNSSADISPTAGQMARLVGLAQASKFYRDNKDLHDKTSFSNKGNEVAFGTIGDASTSEGPFWEAINAAGVLQVPMAMSVWDDGYGISVPKKYQTTKESISEALSGFQRKEGTNGYEIFKVKGWDYLNLCLTYKKAIEQCRTEHVPVLIHVEEVTQPQGHSTSGSHERYKSKERLEWSAEYDCIAQFKKFILESDVYGDKLASAEELEAIEKEAKKLVRDGKKAAWNAFIQPQKEEAQEVANLINQMAQGSDHKEKMEAAAKDVLSNPEPIRKDIISNARYCIALARQEASPAKEELISLLEEWKKYNWDRYSSHLYSESEWSALKVEAVPPVYNTDAQEDGRVILRDNFRKIFKNHPEVCTFGEDTGKIGGVNQGMEGMQDEFGELRVSDTGIRECTIAGQGIGLAMRGLRPIAEIQYLDYLLYAIQILSDDLATVQYRTKGGQKAPLIIRTRGHRLEGIWHAGSPMGMIINSIRGIYVCTPRNLTKAAGFYNTLLAADDPALVIEPLNGYRTKEPVPANLGEFREPLGVPETTREGSDLTIVSYGSTFNLCTQAAERLEEFGIDVELIDCQTLIPFDVNHSIVESIKKTNRLLVVDEDVPGGASAFILQQILEEQGGYFHLDSEPTTLAAKEHRPAYGSDGDYFSKPSIEDIFETAYGIMSEADPNNYPPIY
jgi:pyruvate/2-oxoglutarate/acetoin dehydrogenase E1 component/TPP-dependent pyruvate/acetoin dehydrogenase alpha subunit